MTRLPIPILSDDRPLALLTTAFDVLSIAVWALLLYLAARGSRASLTRDLFGVVLAVAAFSGS